MADVMASFKHAIDNITMYNWEGFKGEAIEGYKCD